MSLHSLITVHKKTIIAFLCVIALFVAASLIPLLAGGGPSAETPELSPDYATNAALFADYWEGAENGYSANAILDVSKKKVQECTEFFELTRAESSVDSKEGETTDQGTEYTSVERDGDTINLCRMWSRTIGDWSNWFVMVFDMDTQFVYYYYYSSECVDGTYHGISQYTDLTTLRIAQDIGAGLEYELADIEEVTDRGQTATRATYTKDGRFIKMDISFNYYENILVDLKITCASYNSTKSVSVTEDSQ